MNVSEIKPGVFKDFARNHFLKNMYQTIEYGNLMTIKGYSPIYIGGFINSKLVAASLILVKSIGPNMKYGYAPRGFLIDYYDEEVVKTFTKKVKDHFLIKGYAFIKINPEITYSVLDYENNTKTINGKNKSIIELFKKLGYDKMKDNFYFESLLPRYNPIIYLPEFNLKNNIDQETQNDALKGLRLISGNEHDLEILYKFIEEKTDNKLNFYKKLYDEFKPNDMVDIILVELKYDMYIKYLQKQYNFELEINDKINYEFKQNPKDIDLYNKKMESDKIVNSISSEITTINNRMQNDARSEILGAALVLKYEGRATLFISGQKDDFKKIDVKRFMVYKIIEEYKKANYLYFDLNGMTWDQTENNPYKELNDFKLQFNPTVFEYIGEFDLIINKPFHQLLTSTNKIQKEFEKK